MSSLKKEPELGLFFLSICYGQSVLKNIFHAEKDY
jgi:hypothetical protein